MEIQWLKESEAVTERTGEGGKRIDKYPAMGHWNEKKFRAGK